MKKIYSGKGKFFFVRFASKYFDCRSAAIQRCSRKQKPQIRSFQRKLDEFVLFVVSETNLLGQERRSESVTWRKFDAARCFEEHFFVSVRRSSSPWNFDQINLQRFSLLLSSTDSKSKEFLHGSKQRNQRDNQHFRTRISPSFDSEKKRRKRKTTLVILHERLFNAFHSFSMICFEQKLKEDFDEIRAEIQNESILHEIFSKGWTKANLWKKVKHSSVTRCQRRAEWRRTIVDLTLFNWLRSLSIGKHRTKSKVVAARDS